MNSISDNDLGEFLQKYPLMALRPSTGNKLLLRGTFGFTAAHEAAGVIMDRFELSIVIPLATPTEIPTVFETGGRIPKTSEYHVNGSDGSLCLGSPMQLRICLRENRCLVGFAEKCLIPYLYAISYKIFNGGPMLFGELAHGSQGIFQDYARILGVQSHDQVLNSLYLLGMKKRRANKLPCPCRCGKRVGVCRFNQVIAKLREVELRGWYRSQHNELGQIIKAGRLPVRTERTGRTDTKKSVSELAIKWLPQRRGWLPKLDSTRRRGIALKQDRRIEFLPLPNLLSVSKNWGASTHCLAT